MFDPKDLPQLEADRLKDLLVSGVLDAGAQEAFDRVIWLVSEALDAPLVSVSLIAGQRQWIKSRLAMGPDEDSQNWTLCDHSIDGDVFETPNAALDERFYDHPLVVGEPHARFYAGAPIRSAAGFRWGTLSIIDPKPRRLSHMERAKLRCFADIVESEFKLLSSVQEQDQLRMEAEKAHTIKSAFLSHMSHEIRTPLSGIIGATDLILGGVAKDAEEMTKIIRSSASDLLQLLNEALDTAKIEAGGLDIHPEPTDLAHIADKIRRHFSVLADSKDLDLEVDCLFDGAPETALLIDPVRVRQILVNIVHNAVKFTEAGGVRCELRVAPADIATRRRLVINVLDTGIGMSPEGVAEIFEPFKQLDAGIQRAYGGTGLGMSLVHKLVQLMGGDIHVTSKLGAGTQISISMDVEAAELSLASSETTQTLSAAEDDEGPAPLEGLRILVAEDNPANAQVLTSVIQAWGGELVLAVDGNAAWAAAKSDVFDAIVLDLHMPGKSGYEVAELIRGAGNWVRMVACTADLTPGVQDRCAQAGFDQSLGKPLDWAAFCAALLGGASIARAA